MAISTPEDFRKKAEERRLEKAEEVVLPSGLTVLAYQPSPEWWVRQVGRLPQTMAARVIGLPLNGDSLTTETLVEFAHWTARLLEYVVVKPKIRLKPESDDEVDANAISDDDLGFLIKYAGGEVTALGHDLDSFPAERRSVTQPDSGGRPLAHAAEPVA